LDVCIPYGQNSKLGGGAEAWVNGQENIILIEAMVICPISV